MAGVQRISTVARVLLIAAMAGTWTGQVASGQTIRGTVVDQSTGRPLPDVLVTALRVTGREIIASATTTGNGAYELMVNRGRILITTQHVGYKSSTRELTIEGSDSVRVVTIHMIPQAVTIDTVSADVQRTWAEPRGTMQHRSQVLAGDKLLSLEVAAASTLSVVTSLPGLRRRGTSRVPCIESTRSIMNLENTGACRMVVVLLDDAPVGTDMLLQPLSSFESVEYLPPADAGIRFGLEASAKGAILLYTRGFGPRRALARDSVRR